MITVSELRAKTPAQHGERFPLGESMFGQVRADANGKVSVYVSWRFRVNGKIREVYVGTWRDGGGISLKALRDERDKLAQLQREGHDPIELRNADRAKAATATAQTIADERQRQIDIEQHLQARESEVQRAKVDSARNPTVRALFERWRTTELTPTTRADGKRVGRKDGGLYVSQQFERHVFPVIGDMSVDVVRKADVLALIDTQKAKGQIRTAAVLLSDLRQMLAFALDRELIDADPLASVKKARIVGVAVERERHLTVEEITTLTSILPTARLHKRSEAAIWVLLATGARVGELIGSIWSDALPTDARQAKNRLASLQARAESDGAKVGVVDTAKRTWHLPDTKNQRSHTIHLSDFALTQFNCLRALRESLPESTEATPWVFPARDATRPVCVKSLGKQFADRQRSPEQRMSGRSKHTESLMLQGGRWTAHDLRRTAGTLMGGMGFSGDVIDECLNHIIESRTRRTYIRDRRVSEQALAFDALGHKLQSIINGGVAGVT